MQRINTATRAIDLFGVGKSGFKDGNLAAGVAPTDFAAAWFNNVQEEIARVIEAAGIALNGASFDQLLTALRSAGVFTTPAQFDNTTKAVTSEFVKRMGMQSSAVSVVAATAALTVAHAGGTVAINAAGATTLTLPAANAVPAGVRIELFNIGAGTSTISRAGADVLQVNNGTATSMLLGFGDSLTVMSDGVSKWYAVGGSAQLGSSAAFASSLAANGYLKLPSGHIFQMGSVSVAGGGSASVTYPFAFSANPKTVASCTSPATGGNVAYVNAQTVTGFSAQVAGTGSNGFTWFANGI